MQGKTATVIGATGLIGSSLVEQLKGDSSYTSIRVLVRRLVDYQHPKIEVRLLNFDDHENFKIAIDGSEAVFCAVGTTTKNVKGDKDAYRKVDFDIPVRAAQYCAETHCPNFLVVSSVAASSKSNNFYLRLKGEMEDAVAAKNIHSISIFRPSMLLGERKESRPGESIGKALFKPLSFLMPSRYKPVQASDVASAMILASKANVSGVKVYHYSEMMQLLATEDLHQVR